MQTSPFLLFFLSQKITVNRNNKNNNSNNDNDNGNSNNNHNNNNNGGCNHKITKNIKEKQRRQHQRIEVRT